MSESWSLSVEPLKICDADEENSTHSFTQSQDDVPPETLSDPLRVDWPKVLFFLLFFLPLFLSFFHTDNIETTPVFPPVKFLNQNFFSLIHRR